MLAKPSEHHDPTAMITLLTTSEATIPHQNTKCSDIFSNYYLQYFDGKNNVKQKLDPGKIIEIELESNTNLFGTDSKIEVLANALLADNEIYSALNMLISKRGALGILSNKPKDGLESITFDDTTIVEIQKELENYGLKKDQWQMIVLCFLR